MVTLRVAASVIVAFLSASSECGMVLKAGNVVVVNVLVASKSQTNGEVDEYLYVATSAELALVSVLNEAIIGTLGHASILAGGVKSGA